MTERRAGEVLCFRARLAALPALSIGLACAAAVPPSPVFTPSEGAPVKPKPPEPIPPELADAFDRLMTATKLAWPRADADAVSPDAGAFRTIRGSPRAGEVYWRLIREARVAGQLYGLCGALVVGTIPCAKVPAAWAAAAERITVVGAGAKDYWGKEEDDWEVGQFLVLPGTQDASGVFLRFCADVAGMRLPACRSSSTQADILVAMRAIQPSVHACCEDTGTCGTVMVRVQIAQGGRLVSAKVTDRHAQTPVGDCLEAAMAAIKFTDLRAFSYPWPLTCSSTKCRGKGAR